MIHLFMLMVEWWGVSSAVGITLIAVLVVWALGPEAWVVGGAVLGASTVAWLFPAAFGTAAAWFGIALLIVSALVVPGWLLWRRHRTRGDRYLEAVAKGDTSAWWEKRTVAERVCEAFDRIRPGWWPSDFDEPRDKPNKQKPIVVRATVQEEPQPPRVLTPAEYARVLEQRRADQVEPPRTERPQW